MLTLLHLGVLTATVLALGRFVSGVRIKNVPSAAGAAVVFSLLNWAVGWLLSGVLKFVLFIPAVLTFGLLFFVVPFVVNAALLWLTDKLLEALEIRDLRALLVSSAAITLASGLFHAIARG